ncbi:hypothetical protein Pyn_18976 [Prunus yedoensis var. nudiflora]|uniref:Uncharacterized protein n=1 Tax=Prunus yedoensis var. nudiflora TaxID=2094558 RepID=A0A314YVZ8_PRUYE|nr:hypothetical protein Pyn_18976 [Prunus yedoensis var. nudiflora]
MKGKPRGGKARVGRKGRGAVRGRGARARGDAIGGRGVVSEQQQTQARPKFNVQVPNLLHNLPKVHKLLHNLPKVYKLIKVQVHNLNQW